jgi:SPP1 family predicted phage head-tail adaptor
MRSKRVTFQRRVRADDPLGDSRGTDTWEDLATVDANILPLRGEERVLAHQLQSSVTHKIQCRWSTAMGGLTPADRIRLVRNTVLWSGENTSFIAPAATPFVQENIIPDTGYDITDPPPNYSALPQAGTADVLVNKTRQHTRTITRILSLPPPPTPAYFYFVLDPVASGDDYHAGDGLDIVRPSYRTFDINAVLNVGEGNRHMEIMAKEMN